MSLRILALILFSVSLSGLAQVSFKIGTAALSVRTTMDGGSVPAILQAFLFSPGVVAGLGMYGIGTLVWLGVLARTELSLAYPFVGLSFVVTALFGYFMFHEALTPGRIAGTALVIAGVILVARA